MQRPFARAAVLCCAVLLAAAAYLLLWPVPLEPLAWQAPPDGGHVDPFATNNRLRAASHIDLDGHSGPESAALGPDGKLYISSREGAILRLDINSGRLEVFAEAGGLPLGIEFDHEGALLVANATLGVQRIDRDGNVALLFDSVAGSALLYPNAIAVTADGRIFVSDSTNRFSPADHGGTCKASSIDIIEHGSSGRVIEFDPASQLARVFAAGLSFANGIAVSQDQRYLLVAETGAYRIWRYPLDGRQRELVIDNLPGFPGNLDNGMQGRIWAGLLTPRNGLLDRFAGRPFLRKVVMRLPPTWRPQAVPHSHVIAINTDGQVLMDLQDSAASFPFITGVIETRRSLYLTGLSGGRLGHLDKDDLARQ